ncbi:flagellar biosynthesis protein FlgA [Arthrobacter sp. Soil782]|uniref:Flp pilus assembly protein CpaB n=1 Tax=Arthrobacter sp. Soil782 TaxID=1736410 RepID=UPI0006F5EF8F|nr:Flp pilus assembly protein CpaB [Arthrobacter sp. Soil782]KRF08445.1 flagellar biosynthesis protein FlgA [Arthrobacter sp. Soil782]
MKSRLIAGVAAVVLALVGAVMVFSYANRADARAVQDLEPVEVLVVQAAVPAGTPVADLAASVATTQLPGASVAETALKDLESSAGMVTAVDLVPGEQLVTERLVKPEDLVTPGTVEVPAGLHEVSILVEPQRIAGGRVVAGDYVGIFVSMETGGVEDPPDAQSTQLVVPRVLVSAVQRAPEPAPADAEATEEEAATAKAEALPTGSLMLTVAVNPDQATRLVFASEYESIWLSKATAAENDAPPFIVQDKELYR